MRVVANGLRNRAKTDAALVADSERRMEALIAEIEAALEIPTPEGGPGNGSTEGSQQDRLAAA